VILHWYDSIQSERKSPDLYHPLVKDRDADQTRRTHPDSDHLERGSDRVAGGTRGDDPVPEYLQPLIDAQHSGVSAELD